MPRTSILAAFISSIVVLSSAASATSRLFVQDPNRAVAAHLEDTQGPFTSSVRQKLRERRFADLDTIAEDLLRTKARFPGGDWKLYRFFDAVGRPDGDAGDLSDRSITDLARDGARLGAGGPDVRSDLGWQTHIALLRSWRS